MKRIIHIVVTVIAFMFFFTDIKVHAQYFKGGLLFGFTGSQMDGDSLSGYNKFGITTGFFIRHNINEKFAVQSEYKYIMKGAATKNDSNIIQGAYSQTLHYAEVPVTVIYTATKRIELEAGLAFALLIYDSRYLFYDDLIERSKMNKYDLSSVLGVSYTYSDNLSVNLKFMYSLTAVSLNYPTNPTIFTNSGQLNNVLALAVYYKFN